MVNRAVYTALIGDYEQLQPQPAASKSDIPFICLSNSTHGEVEGWSPVKVTAPVPGDSVRSARLLKILGHPALAEFEETLWIDNRVVLQLDPNKIFDTLSVESDLAVPLHSFRASLSEEFDAILQNRLDDPRRVREQRWTYTRLAAGVLSEKPYWTAILLRRQTPHTRELQRLWANEVLRFSRRDQLSFNAARSWANAKCEPIEMDNLKSTWHRWVDESQIGRDFSVSRFSSQQFQYSVRMHLSDELERRRISGAMRRIARNLRGAR